ncbi:MAG: hypothetical protein J6X66_01770 [Lachnospiraceae bacterium]|nr:hypothetical protein [Lachnospiraceae bacterium]
MEFKQIFEDNVSDYSDYIDSDIAENLKRTQYRGIAGHDLEDDSILSLLIWKLESVDDSLATDSEFQWLYTADPSYISELIAGYKDEARLSSVRKTYYESTELEKENEVR